jgi:O-antigen ligase
MQSYSIQTIPWMFRLLFVSFFLPPVIQTWLFIACTTLTVIMAIAYRIKLTLQECCLAGLLGVGYLFYLAYLPLTTPEMRYLLYQLLERKIALFCLPFVIPLLLKMSNNSFQSSLKWFVGANLLHGVCTNGLVFYQLLQLFTFSSIHHVTYRETFDKIGHIHPTYYGMFCCFSLVILLYDRSFKSLHYLALLSIHFLFILLLLLLSPKISLLIAGLIYLYYFLFVLSWKPIYKGALFAVACLSLLGLYFLLPSFQQRIDEVISFGMHPNTLMIDNSMQFRQLILQVDLNLLRQFWLWGLGPVQLQQHLDMTYLLMSKVTGMGFYSYNTHNEWLNQWLCFGLAGFLYFVGIFVIHLKKALQQRHFLYLFFIFILMLTCLTENILSRQSGILFMALFGSLFYFEGVRGKLKNGDLGDLKQS